MLTSSLFQEKLEAALELLVGRPSGMTFLRDGYPLLA